MAARVADEFQVDGADLADGLGELGVGALTLARLVGQPPVVALPDHPETGRT
jgi:hypothetical protein